MLIREFIGLEDIPLEGLYPSLGVDRALALWGAGATWGFPCLVIDGGTALTLTGGNGDGFLVGGAILPGLRLQLQSLGRGNGCFTICEVERRVTRALEVGYIVSYGEWGYLYCFGRD